MQQLHLVGFTTDHRGLILGAQKDTESGSYIVLVDNSLVDQIEELLRLREEKPTHRDVTRGADGNGTRPLLARPRPESRLTPREVQASLRTGQTLREVAAAAGVPEEWVARFAAPVLAEQAQVIERTNLLTYTKPRLGPSTQPLAESVAWNLADRGVALTAEELSDAWSAFQQGGGGWVVRVSYLSRKRSQHADWVADLSEGTLTAVNRLATELGYVEPGRRRPPGLRPLTPPAAASAPSRAPAAVPPPRSGASGTSRSVAAAAMAAAAARSAAAADAARAVPRSSSTRSGSAGIGGRSTLSPSVSGRSPAPPAPPASSTAGPSGAARSGPSGSTPPSPPPPSPSPSPSSSPPSTAGTPSVRRPSAKPEDKVGRGSAAKDQAPAARRERPLSPKPTASDSPTGTLKRGVPARGAPSSAPAPAEGSPPRPAPASRPLRSSGRSADPTPKAEARPANVDRSLSPTPPARGSTNGGSRPLFARSARETLPAAGSREADTAGSPAPEVRRSATPSPAATEPPATPGRSPVATGRGRPAAEPPTRSPAAAGRTSPAAARSLSTADRFGPLASRPGVSTTAKPAPRGAPRPARDAAPSTGGARTAGTDRPAARSSARAGGSAASDTSAARLSARGGGSPVSDTSAARLSARAGGSPVSDTSAARSAARAGGSAASAARSVAGKSAGTPVRPAAAAGGPRRADRPLVSPDRPRRERPLVAPSRQGTAPRAAGADEAASPTPRRPAPAPDPVELGRNADREPDTAPVVVVDAIEAWAPPAADLRPPDEGLVLIKAGQAGTTEDDLDRDPYEEQWRNAGPQSKGDGPPDEGRRSRLRLRRRSGSR